MSTGYTASIAKGITFKEYALECAKAFGCNITSLKYVHNNPDINYHLDELKKCEKAKSDFISNDKAKYQMFLDYKQTEKSNILQAIKDNAALKTKYAKMLTLCKKFKAPTKNHIEFKKFMISQIENSIEFDCYEENHYKCKLKNNENLTFEEWCKVKMNNLDHEIDYHKTAYEEDCKHEKDTRKWVSELCSAIKAVK